MFTVWTSLWHLSASDNTFKECQTGRFNWVVFYPILRTSQVWEWVFFSNSRNQAFNSSREIYWMTKTFLSYRKPFLCAPTSLPFFSTLFFNLPAVYIVLLDRLNIRTFSGFDFRGELGGWLGVSSMLSKFNQQRKSHKIWRNNLSFNIANTSHSFLSCLRLEKSILNLYQGHMVVRIFPPYLLLRKHPHAHIAVGINNCTAITLTAGAYLSVKK